ncbi:SubName: Full=Uncharacterized protein {ECO:0000313/EMBL:CCA75493.1} [Serendipita indica DSM 11827]|uniref:Uncharacterized protein n=1 Tax=Serendipita indica (strain DSM 11827) TaxID=1109443 RepID=G4TW00_SERID|nr:SubName: Full=Uncharacterized protein {ECO:0000313/EMBL:CCA75493.1} [Serendipita indica DSM 11827]CCA75493.1 hypothetical protein PIIN_09476 [Serendipita indica DSM 11827]
MSLRTAATRLPRSTMRVAVMPKRSVGGTSTPPHNKRSKDLPWIVGGVAVLVPTVYYFVGSSALKHGENISNDAKAVPVAEKVGLSGQPGGKEDMPAGGPSNQDVQATLAREMRADAPKTAYHAEEEAAKKRQPAGGPSHDELEATIERELRTDAPKTAYYAEEEAAKKKQPAGGPSGDDVQASIQRGLRADAPKTAYQAEEESARKKQRI